MFCICNHNVRAHPPVRYKKQVVTCVLAEIKVRVWHVTTIIKVKEVSQEIFFPKLLVFTSTYIYQEEKGHRISTKPSYVLNRCCKRDENFNKIQLFHWWKWLTSYICHMQVHDWRKLKLRWRTDLQVTYYGGNFASCIAVRFSFPLPTGLLLWIIVDH